MEKNNGIIIEQTRDLLIQYKNGNVNVINDILLLNDPLVISIARNIYKNTYRHIDVEELIQEGRIGLYHAVLRFDIDKGCNFSTYATYWVKKYIKRYISKNLRVGSISEHYLRQVVKIEKFINSYFLLYNTFPEDEVIGKELNISVDNLKELKGLLDYELSLDHNFQEDEEENNALARLTCSEDLEETVLNNYLKEKILDIIYSLDSERQRMVLIYRFGLIHGIEMTLQEIGDMYGCTRQSIYNTEKDAMANVKVKCLKYGLEQFLQ